MRAQVDRVDGDKFAAAENFGFSRESRLLKRRQFLAVSRRNPRPDVVITSGSFLVLGRRNGLDRNRLGVTVSKKTARRAVVRNRVKRQVRDFFRLNTGRWPQGLDLVFIARTGADQAERTQLREDLGRAGRKLSAWTSDQPKGGGPKDPGRSQAPVPAAPPADGPPDRLWSDICSGLQEGPGRLALGFIRFYQRFISPLTPPACRFWPTCSNYALQAIKGHGFWRGSWLTARRLLKCHPFHPGGYDPVPPPKR